MCYKKPGPRCSPHAYTNMAEQRARLAKYRSRIDDPDHSLRRASNIKLAEKAEQELRRRSDEFAITPEGLRLLAHRYGNQPNGAQMYAAAKKKRLDLQALVNVERRAQDRRKRLEEEALSNQLTGDSSNDEDNEPVAPNGLRRGGGGGGFKPVQEQLERWTYRKTLAGKTTQELHDLAADVLMGRVKADPHLLTRIVQKRTSNLATVRMVARSCSNLEVRAQALEILATRALQIRAIPARNKPEALDVDTEVVDARVSDLEHTRALHSTLLRVAENERYAQVDRSDMDNRIQGALNRERDALERGTATVEQAVLAQP